MQIYQPTVTGSFTVITGSSVELSVTNTGVNIGNTISDTHTLTGSLNVSGSVLIQNASLISPYGQVVFATASSGINIASAAFASIISPTITGISVGDSIEVQLTGLILNNSGGARTYTVTSSFAGIQMAVVNGNSTAASATNQQPVDIKIIYSVISTSLVYAQKSVSFTSPGAANTSQNAVLAQTRTVWQTSTNNITGSQTMNVGMRSDATAGQTFSITSAIIRRTPLRPAI